MAVRPCQYLAYTLLTVTDTYFYAELVMYVFGKMLCAVHAAVLSSSASEAEHKARKATLYVSAYMVVGQLIHAVEERQYLAIILKEAYDGLIKPRQLFVRLISSRVMR